MALKKWGGGTNPVPNLWSEDLGWTGDTKPANGDDVVFDATYTGDCSIDEATASLESFLMDTGYTGTVSMGFLGVLNVDNTADGSNFTGTQGTFDCISGTVTVSGDLDTSSSNFTFTRNSGAVVLTGTGTVTTRDTTTNGFRNLTCAAAGKITTLASDIGVYGTLTVTAGSLVKDGYLIDGNSSGTLDVDGTLQDKNTAFDQAYAIKDAVVDVAGTYDHLNAWLIGCSGTGSGVIVDDDKAILEGVDMTLITVRESALQDPVTSVSTPM